MAEKEQSQHKRIRAFPAALLLIVLVMGGFALLGERGVLRTMRLQQQRQHLAADLARLQAREDSLRRQIDRLKQDPAYQELLARRELGWVRKDEIVYLFPSASR